MGRLLTTLAAAGTRYFGLLVVLGTLLALAHPPLFLPLLPYIKWMLGLIMFGMGMTLRFEDFARVAKQPFAILAGVACQFTIMPLVGLGVALLLHLPPELATGIVLLGACPGGTASNVIVFLARGDVALSVSMTAVSTLLAPLLTPLITLFLAGQWMEVSATALLVDILKIVVIPVLAGLLIHGLAPRAASRAVSILPLVSVLMILLIIASIIAANRGNVISAGPIVLLAVVLHNLSGLSLGWCAARMLRLDNAQIRAITVEVGMQNSGLATALASAHISPLAALPGALFSVWHNISGAILVSLWRSNSGSK